MAILLSEKVSKRGVMYWFKAHDAGEKTFTELVPEISDWLEEHHPDPIKNEADSDTEHFSLCSDTVN